MSSGWGNPSGSGVSGSPGDTYRHSETRTVTPSEIAQKYLILDQTPSSRPETSVAIKGGPDQFIDIDFTVTTDDGGRRLSWDGLGLDGVIEQGDVLQIEYPIIT